MATKSITIADNKFEVTTPYVEGQALTAAEARSLNQTRCENVRNNTAKEVKKFVAAGDLNGATSYVATYDRDYTFAMPGASGARVVRDPLEREIRSIIKESLKIELAKSGRKLKDVEDEKIEAIIEKNSENPEVIKMAKKRVAAKQSSAGLALEGLSEPSPN